MASILRSVSHGRNGFLFCHDGKDSSIGAVSRVKVWSTNDGRHAITATSTQVYGEDDGLPVGEVARCMGSVPQGFTDQPMAVVMQDYRKLIRGEMTSEEKQHARLLAKTISGYYG